VPHAASTDQRVDAVFYPPDIAGFDRQMPAGTLTTPTRCDDVRGRCAVDRRGPGRGWRPPSADLGRGTRGTQGRAATTKPARARSRATESHGRPRPGRWRRRGGGMRSKTSRERSSHGGVQRRRDRHPRPARRARDPARHPRHRQRGGSATSAARRGACASSVGCEGGGASGWRRVSGSVPGGARAISSRQRTGVLHRAGRLPRPRG